MREEPMAALAEGRLARYAHVYARSWFAISQLVPAHVFSTVG